MLSTVGTELFCSCPAIWECAVTFPTVRPAGLEPADHLVAAACNPTFTFTTAMFGTETPGVRGGGAARHGALWLFLSTTMCVAMLEPLSCIGGASVKLALATCTMLVAETARISKSGTILRLAHFLAAVTAMPPAVSLFIPGGSIAGVESAEPKGTMFRAEATSTSSCIAPIRRASHSVGEMFETHRSS